jgi:hypothetical protein
MVLKRGSRLSKPHQPDPHPVISNLGPRYFHLDRPTPFISSAILRIRSRICFRIATLSSSDNSAGDGAAAGNGGNRGTIQMSIETSKETTLADTHQWEYIIIPSA